MARPPARSVATIVIIYALAGGLWILFSDLALEALVADSHDMTAIQTYKGWIFVLGSAALIGWLVRSDIRARERERQQAEAERSRLLAHAEAVLADAEAAQREAQEAAATAGLHASQLRGLADASLAVHSATTIDQVLQRVTDQARNIIGAHRCMTSLRTESDWSSAQHAVSVSDRYPQWRGSSRQLHGEGQGWLAAPLIAKDGRNFGVIQIADKYDGEFGGQDEAVLVQLAQFAAVAVENVRLYDTAREAEYRLRRQLLFTHAITGSMGDGVCAVDAEGFITFANPASAQALGWSESELLGRSLCDIADCRDPDSEPDSLGSCMTLSVLKTGKPLIMDDRIFIRQDGASLPVDYAAAPIMVDGVITGAVLTFRDITQRKRAAAELQEFNERIRTIFESISDAFLALDTEWRFTFLNDAAARLLRVTAAEMIGRSIWDAFPDVVGSTFEREYRCAAQDQVAVHFEEFFPPLGAWFEVNAYPARTGLSVYFRDITSRKEAEAALRFQAQMLDVVQNAIMATDADYRIIYWNSSAQRQMGWTASEVMGRHMVEVLAPVDSPMSNLISSNKGQGFNGELVMRRKDGSEFTSLVTGSPMWDAEGRRIGLIGVSLDVSDRKRTEKALVEQERLYRLIADNATDLIGLYNADWSLQYVSPSWSPILGYTPEDLVHGNPVPLESLVHPEESEHFGRTFKAIVAAGDTASLSHRLRKKDGEYLWVETTIRPVRDDQGNVTQVRTSSRDISERRVFEQQLAHQAFHDSLTNLPNRALFSNRLEHALNRSRRRKDTLAVLFLDLDRFKVINDSLGHHVGDQLLAAVGPRLLRCVRAGDTVARIGGDEFTILLEDIDGESDAVVVAERIAAELTAAFALGEHEVFVTTSVGIVVVTDGGYSPEELLRYADVAMYRAKSRGKAQYEVFDPSMNERAVERLQLETDFRRAIERGEFHLRYQPIVNLVTGETMGFEALIRWDYPHHGIISPSEFIPLAEETGLIIPVGDWVLREACRQLRCWQLAYPRKRPLAVTVNLSAVQFGQPHLVEEVARVLEHERLDPSSLVLEITESVLMRDVDKAVAMLRELKRLGVGVAIDDFGTGYSSLTYLKRFPVDILKIDPSFVGGLGKDPQDTAIVVTVLTLAETLNLQVVAEGIECEGPLIQLQALKCEWGQGYLFAQPLTAEDASDALAHGHLQFKPVMPQRRHKG